MCDITSDKTKTEDFKPEVPHQRNTYTFISSLKETTGLEMNLLFLWHLDGHFRFRNVIFKSYVTWRKKFRIFVFSSVETNCSEANFSFR